METGPSRCRRGDRHARSNPSSTQLRISRSHVNTPPLAGADSRWVDQFTKLHVWKLTQYERIVYVDSDMFPLANTEELFDLDLDQQSTTYPPYKYSFAAVHNLVGQAEHHPITGGGFNAGFFVLKPDIAMFDRLWKVAMDPKQPWNDSKDMEQGLLVSFFDPNGPSPLHELEWFWNCKDMPDKYMGSAKMVHARYTPGILYQQ
jgi:alpha-N-acetylglucosamine transferase